MIFQKFLSPKAPAETELFERETNYSHGWYFLRTHMDIFLSHRSLG